MITLHATITLPYLLRLPDGDYPTGGTDGPLRLQKYDVPDTIDSSAKHTAVSIPFEAGESLTPQQQLDIKKSQAGRLVRQTNRLIRWYRAATRQAAIVELTRSQANPIEFTTESGAAWASDVPFEYDADPPSPLPLPAKSIESKVREGLESAADPDVADLFLLDAEQARRGGRFRETVLFCWSTIDATFNRKYDELVNHKLQGEWSSAREFFTGVDFGMKNKMSASLFLVSGRSLFREPDDLWKRLSDSYKKRNDIIHRGENADETDAEKALDVADRVVKIMASFDKAPAPKAAE